jgi:large subunit ribosomal protein L24e
MFCVFCNNEIPKGKGEIFVFHDGNSLVFCSNKCKVNMLKLKREGRLVKWTNKGVVIQKEEKEETKKESVLAKEIEQKLAEKAAQKTESKKK